MNIKIATRVLVAKLFLLALALVAVAFGDAMVHRGAAVGMAVAIFLLFFLLMSNTLRRFFMSGVGYWAAFVVVTLLAMKVSGEGVTGYISVAYANIAKVALLDLLMWWFKDDRMTMEGVKEYWRPKLRTMRFWKKAA